jgi:hypothetical protein
MKLKNSHTGGQSPTLINRIEKQMDNRRKWLEDFVVRNGGESMYSLDYMQQRGRYEGFGAALAILRSSSLDHEIERSNGRLGIE